MAIFEGTLKSRLVLVGLGVLVRTVKGLNVVRFIFDSGCGQEFGTMNDWIAVNANEADEPVKKGAADGVFF